ncbi:MAG: hypothetical protein EDM75_16305 [Chlorobiota bacterium]|nr:MAG: hypothetical protein EDM75_16305 [Chlorobiota bacterium]
MRPDGLAWGRIQGFETLFWLETGDEHKKKEEIEDITRKRWTKALAFCRETGVRLIYAQVSPDWVKKAALWAFKNLPEDIAVVIGNTRRFGILPTTI